ncbi:MAG: pyruvate kinase [Dehalococcoidales bacterium]|nr:pyruvate kinase [Dehalococcoidales bacterium]
MDRLRRHVKIVCTLGPASNSPETIGRMLQSGMDVVRLNLSYGTLEEHYQTIARVRSVSQKMKLPTAILLDLPGRKRRTGDGKAVFGDHLQFAQSNQVDFIALSFITSTQQVEEVKSLLKDMGISIPIIVKIEKGEALAVSSSIVDIGDGVMVARGDLGLQISIEKVPLAQKKIIREANQRGKPVITATEMLESMVKSATPTRAEATDVANAVLDGTDAVMLSEETSIGKYPVEAIEMMSKIILEAETVFPHDDVIREPQGEFLNEVDDATARAACQIAYQIEAKAIVALTASGTTALRVAKHRPSQSILAVTNSETVMRRLALVWGVYPLIKSIPANLEEWLELARATALETGIAKADDLIVVTAGFPLGVTGSTNLVKVHSV